MIIAPLPHNEDERLLRTRQLGLLDTLEEQAYDDLTLLASEICDAPIALITLLDEKRQWFKSHHGLDITETSREISFCSHAILQDSLFIVEDADKDIRFKDNPLVTDDPKLKFYAGAPLILDTDIRVGTLCILDTQKRSLSEIQKRSLEALARQVVALFQLRVTIKEMKNLDKVKDEFLAMVSHELRSPLTSLKGSLNILQHLEIQKNGETNSLLDIAVRNTDQLAVIVNDILDVTTMQAGKIKMIFEKVNLASLIKKAVNQNLSRLNKCEVSVHIPDEANIQNVYGDELKLVQVISNLLSNAEKFSPKENAKIKVTVGQESNLAKISISDNGIGIADEFKDQIFTTFHQVGSDPNQKLPGTGLGLSICKHIIKSHNGSIGFTSKPHEKTDFYFTLPLMS